MALFDDPAVFGDEKRTKETLKSAFAKVNANGSKFLYYERLPVGTKEVLALAVVDFAADFESKLKKAVNKAPLARGQCHITKANELVFEADSGTLKLEALRKFMITVPGMRAVHLPIQEAPAALGRDGHDDGPAKPDAALLKRLAALNAQVKQLPGDAGDSFIVQLKKVAALAQTGQPKDAQAAAKLLDALEPMLNKQQSRQAPQVDDAVLKQVNEAVEKAYAALPKRPPGLRADIEATAEAKDFAKAARDPAQARQAAVSAKPLIKKIEEIRALAEAWPAKTLQAEKQFDEAFQAARATSMKSVKDGVGRIDAHLKHPAALEVKRLCADPAAYAKAGELEQAMQQQAKALKERLEKVVQWDEAHKQANLKLKADVDALDKAYAKKIQDAIPKESAYLDLKALGDRGKTEVLDAKLLEAAALKMRERIAAMADEEKRRIQAADVKLKLEAHRPAVAKAVSDCEDLRVRAAAALPALEASWRTATVQTELTDDAQDVGLMRAAATKLRDDIDGAIGDLGAATPPAASVINDAEKLLGAALPNLSDISKRVTRNLKTTTPEGILAQLEVLLKAAAAGQYLSNTRIGNLRAALKRAPKTLVQAQQDITDAVYAQNHPKPGEWLKVLQMPNVRAGGDLRVAKVGDVTIDDKRVDVHLTLFLANLDVHNSPHLGMTAAAVIDAMLPDEEDSKGTHVTAEFHGAKSPGNPHYFKTAGGGRGVPNSLAGHPKWNEIEAAMGGVLDKEVARLTALVQQHIDRHGVWPGE